MAAAARDRLLEWYRRYIGEPDADADLALGFGLFFGGIGFGLLGFVLFLWSAALDPGSLSDPNMTFWTLREVAFTLGMVGLPALMLSIVVLLPVEDRVRYAAAAGAAVTVVAVAAFVATYPFSFNVQPSTTAGVVALYAVGLVVVIGSTGAALVGHHLARAAPEQSDDADTEDVSDEQVQRDIDEAMEGADLTWGGVRTGETRRLTIETDAEEDVDASSFDQVGGNVTRVESADTDSAVDDLRKLRGGERKEARSSSTTDDQAAALRELRESQRREAAERGWLARLRALLGLD